MDDGMGRALLLAGLAFGLALTIVVLFWLSLWRADRQLGERTADVAQRFGLSYVEKWPLEQLADYQGFSLFQQGRRRGVRHVASGTYNGVSVLMMEYDLISRGRNSTRYRHEVVLFPDRSAVLPDLQIEPSTWFNKMAKALKITNRIEFVDDEADARFSENYVVHGPFRGGDAIRAGFRPEARASLADRPGWHGESQNGILVLWKPNFGRIGLGILPTEDFVVFFTEACSIHSALTGVVIAGQLDETDRQSAPAP
jgi:hypothetical protein